MAVIAAAAVAAVGVGVSAYQGEQSRKAAKSAAAMQLDQAQKSAKQEDEAFNKANQKKPNIEALMAANQMPSGVSTTTLTGPTGASVTPGMLGAHRLLGQ